MQKFLLLLTALLLFSCSTKSKIVAVKHSRLPKESGSYSHSTSYDNLIFVSGQIGLDQKNKYPEKKCRGTNGSDYGKSKDSIRRQSIRFWTHYQDNNLFDGYETI